MPDCAGGINDLRHARPWSEVLISLLNITVHRWRGTRKCKVINNVFVSFTDPTASSIRSLLQLLLPFLLIHQLLRLILPCYLTQATTYLDHCLCAEALVRVGAFVNIRTTIYLLPQNYRTHILTINAKTTK